MGILSFICKSSKDKSIKKKLKMPPKQKKPMSILDQLAQGTLTSALDQSRASSSATPAKRAGSTKGMQESPKKSQSKANLEKVSPS